MCVLQAVREPKHDGATQEVVCAAERELGRERSQGGGAATQSSLDPRQRAVQYGAQAETQQAQRRQQQEDRQGAWVNSLSNQYVCTKLLQLKLNHNCLIFGCMKKCALTTVHM